MMASRLSARGPAGPLLPNLDICFQLDSKPFSNLQLHQFDQPQNLFAASIRIGNDEIRVFLADFCSPDLGTLQPRLCRSVFLS